MAGQPWPSWLLVGPTGLGKTPPGDELERRGFLGRRCVHLDFGANLRRIAAAPEPEAGFTALELQSVRDSLVVTPVALTVTKRKETINRGIILLTGAPLISYIYNLDNPQGGGIVEQTPV